MMNIPVDCVPEVSPSSGADQHHALSVQKEESGGRERAPVGSPALPSRLNRFNMCPADVASPLKDPRRQRATLRDTDSPTLHHRQLPQYTGENWSPSPVHKLVMKDSPEPSVKLYVEQRGGVPDVEAPVSWTSRQQWGGVPGWGGDSPKVGEQAEGCMGGAPNVLLQKEAELRTREALLLGPVMLEHPQGQDARDEQQSSLAPGGWTVLLKADEEEQQPGCSPNSRGDRGCTSPESTVSSHRSYEMGHTTSGIQSDSGLSSMGPSLHSQKIARAKWEFLFGTSGDNASTGSKDNPDASTTPPSGTSSESPTPTPPTSLPLEGQRSANHDVQDVEVELVTPPPMAAGASPKTGIIRRTIKYSETDLDAVPLRCYRETDIDEVLADQDEADSAFGSNRSVPGTPGSSPLGGTQYERMDAEEDEDDEDEEEEEDEDEEEGEGEVLSWSTVRRQGDRKRYRNPRDESEAFSVLLKRPLDGLFHCHPALKSPILVSGPRLAAEDTFSRHFESIMESHRAKGTSYSSLDSEDLLTSSGQSVLTFDLPTLTPEVQCQTYQSAREIVGLSFAPLARRETPSGSEDTLAALDSDATRAPSSERLSTCSEDTPSWGWYSALSPRERPPRAAVDSDLDRDLSELLGLGSTDTLTNGSKADLEAAKRLAKRLYTRDGFRKSDVAKQLCKNNDFSRIVAEEYLRFFHFRGMTLDQGLRTFLTEFALMGETQERERVLAHFSRRYIHCNPSSVLSEDSVHTLTCALMLLNTDLHGYNTGKRMSYLQFIGNLEGLNDGQDFPKDLLKALYNSIKNEKLQWTIDEEELRKSFSELADGRADSASRSMKRVDSGGNVFTGVSSQSGTLVYKAGFLVRKVHADSDGKRTPRGKRGWKTFYAVLKGLILYLQKGEFRPEKQLSDEDLKNAVSIHHSLAMRAADYSKRPNVFYLRTADWRVYLFQAPNAEQMQSWITRINTVAALFSAPPFPAAIGSQKKFSRPLLPGTRSKLSEEEQVQSHEARFRSTSSELAELRSYPPDRKVKGRELEEYRQRDEYLEFEKTRYGTYAMLLRAKIRCGEDDLSVLESQILEDSELQRADSSPTLDCDSSLASNSKASSKRNEGQRHSYRQAVKK
ncbi:PH and SEC7 domain-containing protein 1-like isoform X2 [Conger conger]|uniref:PH and SEC7 domain-containing protein 1-like isoform X2 n=1 Tax=Conger conger TaxID=82655 RepID=UPI002A59FB98|nr:PH and SEC7 domain-containing protein 1-like isoform X2 [Conger conger]